ncbi:hypothetical protein CDAR_66141 [Caerostris darwini]|uniref:Uncharacterized protein n=1 Tax=Caerostris darwini TaxID=1538125 RepID=A0AAV4TXH6_9ARAC|nr:hypothetical protein CDAR_66141 [Caerostris darwini]
MLRPSLSYSFKPWIGGEELFSGVHRLKDFRVGSPLASLDIISHVGGEELFSGVPRLKDFRRFTTYIAGGDVLDNIKKSHAEIVLIFPPCCALHM